MMVGRLPDNIQKAGGKMRLYLRERGDWSNWGLSHTGNLLNIEGISREKFLSIMQ